MDASPSTIRRSADSQRALEEAFVARESWAFEAAYATYRRLLYGTAYGVLHDAQDAEDCVHDVLVRLWQRRHSFTAARGSLHAFLCVCVRNDALSRRRRTANRQRIEREKLDASAVEPAIDTAVHNQVDVDRSMQLLTQPQREAIHLAYFEGLTHEQIATRLGEPVGTVKSRISNALRTLRTAFARGRT